MMTGTAQFQISNYTVDDPSTYRAKIDGNAMVAQPVVAAFQVYQQNPASMTLNIAAGAVPGYGNVPTAVTTQGTPSFVAPTSNPRNDIVYVDALTGVVGVTQGVEAGMATDPSITPGTIALARVRLTVGMTAITNPDIDDLRVGIVPHMSFSTGDVKLTLKSVADWGWVICDDGTIGNASSGATTRANADTQALFALLWNNVSDAYATVSGGRGTDAMADFTAGKTIALTKMLGRTLALAGSGAGLTSRALGFVNGAETITPSVSQMPSHRHRSYLSNNNALSGTVLSASTNQYYGGYYDTLPSNGGIAYIENTGGGGAMSLMQPTAFLNAMIKL